MNAAVESFVLWLADYYLLSTVLLAGVCGLLAVTRQPARRIAVTTGALAALALLAALVALPGWSLVHLTAREAAATQKLQETPAEFSLDQHAASEQVEPGTPGPDFHREHVVLDDGLIAAAAATPAEAPAALPLWRRIDGPLAATAVFLAGSLGVVAWLVAGALRARQVSKAAVPGPAEVEALLRELIERDLSTRRIGHTSFQRSPRLLITDRIASAAALGLRRPTILLPATLLVTADRSALRTVLAHEYAHVKSGDLWLLAATRLLLVLHWAQPLFWLLRARLRFDQEALADAAAAEQSGPESYATQLVEWARASTGAKNPKLAGAVGLWESRSQLRHRIALLLDERIKVLTSCPRPWRIASLAACVFIAATLSLVTIRPGAASPSSAADDAANAKLAAQELALANGDFQSNQVAPDNPKSPDTDTKDDFVPIPIIVAKHVMLVDGQIVDWKGIEERIKSLPDPKKAYPQYYLTSGAHESQLNWEEVQRHEHDNRAALGYERSSFGSVIPRSSLYYDNVRTAADLVPDEKLRIEGVVKSADGKPLAGAEVALITSPDKSIAYRTVTVVLKHGRLRDRQDEVVADTDEAGRFQLYPPKGEPYLVAAIHPQGFAIVRDDLFGREKTLTLQPWAKIEGRITLESPYEQYAQPTVDVPVDDHWTEDLDVQFTVESVGDTDDAGVFSLPFVPPDVPGLLYRYISNEHGSTGLFYEKFQLEPGETRRMNIGPLTENDLDMLRQMRELMKQRASKQPAAKAEPASQPDASETTVALADEASNEKAAQAATAVPDPKPTELAGTVVDEQGQPIEGVTVDAWTWYKGHETKTDAHGHFILRLLGANEPTEVQFTKEGYCPALFVEQRAGSKNWVVTLNNRTYLEGRVLGPDGKPAANVLIRAARGPFRNPGVTISEVWTETRSNAEGRYRLYAEPDKYDIQLRVPGVGVARYPDTHLVADEHKLLDIELRHGVDFIAQFVDSETGEPVSGITLWNWRQPGIEGTSDDRGIAKVLAMFPGTFDFQLRAGNEKARALAGNYARWWSDNALREHQQKAKPNRRGFQRNLDDLAFHVHPGMPPVTIVVERCVTITGRVVDPDGKPVAAATVAPALTGSGNSLTGDTRYSVRTADDGTFEMRLPASGGAQYNLVAHDGNFRQWRTWANGVGEPFRTKPGEEIRDVELRLTRPGTVRGVVLDAAGKPAINREVQAQPLDKLENRYYVPTTRTDKEGRFELRFVRPGEQYIQAEPFWLVAEEAPAETSKRVMVTEGEPSEGVELRAGG